MLCQQNVESHICGQLLVQGSTTFQNTLEELFIVVLILYHVLQATLWLEVGKATSVANCQYQSSTTFQSAFGICLIMILIFYLSHLSLAFDTKSQSHFKTPLSFVSQWFWFYTRCFRSIFCQRQVRSHLSLHEKPYFPSPGISCKAKKYQVNTIFPSTFWLKKDRISHHRKVRNKNFSVTTKYHLSINVLTQKRPYFPSPKCSKQELSVTGKYYLSIRFLAQKKVVFPIYEKIKTRTFQKSVNNIFPSIYWRKNTTFFISKKFKKRKFLVISKHDIPC